MLRNLSHDSLAPALALVRLRALTDLSREADAAIMAAMGRWRMVKSRREIVSERQEYRGAQIIMSGWAARVRILPDGRRQLLGFFLPGDVIGCCDHPRPITPSAVVAITTATLFAAPRPGHLADLERAYALSRALEEAYLLSQITRLGRMDARERLSDLLLELHERLVPCGLSQSGRFALPLTQEMLADALGLTPVHINRTLQSMRRDGDVIWSGGEMTICNPAVLAERIGRTPIIISAERSTNAPKPPVG